MNVSLNDNGKLLATFYLNDRRIQQYYVDTILGRDKWGTDIRKGNGLCLDADSNLGIGQPTIGQIGDWLAGFVNIPPKDEKITIGKDPTDSLEDDPEVKKSIFESISEFKRRGLTGEDLRIETESELIYIITQAQQSAEDMGINDEIYLYTRIAEEADFGEASRYYLDLYEEEAKVRQKKIQSDADFIRSHIIFAKPMVFQEQKLSLDEIVKKYSDEIALLTFLLQASAWDTYWEKGHPIFRYSIYDANDEYAPEELAIKYKHPYRMIELDTIPKSVLALNSDGGHNEVYNRPMATSAKDVPRGMPYVAIKKKAARPKKPAVTKKTPICDWYKNEYGVNALYLGTQLSFEDTYKLIQNKDYFPIIYQDDPEFRERVFRKMAEVMGKSYNDIENLWKKNSYIEIDPEVSRAVDIMNNAYDEFYQCVENYGTELYKGSSKEYDNLVLRGDGYIKKYNSFVREMVKARGMDPISSDREVAAMAVALETLGIPSKTKRGKVSVPKKPSEPTVKAKSTTKTNSPSSKVGKSVKSPKKTVEKKTEKKASVPKKTAAPKKKTALTFSAMPSSMIVPSKAGKKIRRV